MIGNRPFVLIICNTPICFSCPRKVSCIYVLRLLVEERILPLIAYFLVIDNLLRTADEQHASVSQRTTEFAEYLILCFLGKINQYVPADNKMIILRIRIFQQIMFFKLNTLLDFIRNLIGRTDLCKILFLQVVRYGRDTFLIIYADFCFRNNLLIKVGRKIS